MIDEEECLCGYIKIKAGWARVYSRDCPNPEHAEFGGKPNIPQPITPSERERELQARLDHVERAILAWVPSNQKPSALIAELEKALKGDRPETRNRELEKELGFAPGDKVARRIAWGAMSSMDPEQPPNFSETFRIARVISVGHEGIGIVYGNGTREMVRPRDLKHTESEVVVQAISEPEICICAALRLPDGRIFRGHRHADCIRTALYVVEIEGKLWHPSMAREQGFMTSRNRFVDRDEGLTLQLTANVPSAYPAGYRGTLFSEDLY